MVDLSEKVKEKSNKMNRAEKLKNIRLAVHEDAVQIATLIAPYIPLFALNEQGAQKLQQPVIEALLNHATVHYYVYAPDQHIRAVIAFNSAGHLIHFFTAQSFLRQGLGRLLWQYAEASMLAQGNEHISVNSSCDAQGVYEAFGFYAVSSVIEASGLRFIQMRKDLSRAR